VKHSGLVSVGADGQRQTADELIGVSMSRPVFDSGDISYLHDKSWRVPEGLGDVVEQFTDKPRGPLNFQR
jgi:hypothetical protein